MKTLLTLYFMICLLLSSTSYLFAGNAVNKNNWSAEFFRSLNRNASTDYADIVVYNPAGVVKMKDGLYLNASVQYLSKDYSNMFLGRDFEQDEPSWIPGVFALYKRDRWAGFFGFNIVGGGGKIKYNDGNFRTWQLGQIFRIGTNTLLGSPNPLTGPFNTITKMSVDAESYALAYNFGAALRITDWMSASITAKYVDSKQDFKGMASIGDTSGLLPEQTVFAELEETASNWGGVIGLDFFPINDLTIGLRYETRVKLEYTDDVKSDTAGILPAIGIVDGNKAREDLPAILGVGISYQHKALRTEANLTWYFNEDADLGLATNPDLEDRIDDGFEMGIAFEWAFNPAFKASIGYLYSYTGVDPLDMKPENPELDVHSMGGGIAWQPISDLDLNLSIGNAFYQNDSFVDNMTGAGTVEYEKNIFFIAFGIQYRFF